jgi:hypothetical protein
MDALIGVGVAMGNGLDSRGSVPDMGLDSFPFYSVNTGSGAYPAYYPMGIACSFSRDKVVRT